MVSEGQEHISSSNYFSSSNTALMKFSKVLNTAREIGRRFVARRQKKVALSTKWKDHILMVSQKWKTHFVFLPQLFLAMEDKFIQNSLSHLTTNICFGSPRRGKFSFMSSRLLLKRQLIGYSKSDKLCFLLEMTSSDSCIFIRKQLLYNKLPPKK